jgi:hypothetical protein
MATSLVCNPASQQYVARQFGARREHDSHELAPHKFASCELFASNTSSGFGPASFCLREARKAIAAAAAKAAKTTTAKYAQGKNSTAASVTAEFRSLGRNRSERPANNAWPRDELKSS